eukprot:gene14336-15832_t
MTSPQSSAFSIDNLLGNSTKAQDKNKTDNAVRLPGSANDNESIFAPLRHHNYYISLNTTSSLRFGKAEDCALCHKDLYQGNCCLKVRENASGYSNSSPHSACKRQTRREIHASYCASCYEYPCNIRTSNFSEKATAYGSTACHCYDYLGLIYWPRSQYLFNNAPENRGISITDQDYGPADRTVMVHNGIYPRARENTHRNNNTDAAMNAMKACADYDQQKIECLKQVDEGKFDWMINPRPFYKKESKKSLAVSDSKRDRTTFSVRQRSELERQFQKSRYPSRYHRSQMARYLDLTEFQVKVWFQNRRMKFKRWNSVVNHSNDFISSCFRSRVLPE